MTNSAKILLRRVLLGVVVLLGVAVFFWLFPDPTGNLTVTDRGSHGNLEEGARPSANGDLRNLGSRRL